MLTFEKSSRGFTIVELLVVIVVIGVLAAVTIVSYTGISQRALVATVQSDLTGSVRSLKLYYIDHGSKYPASLDPNYCPRDEFNQVDQKYCLKPSNGNSYDYTSYNPWQTFFLVATKGTTMYKITENTKPSIYVPPQTVNIAGAAFTGGAAWGGWQNGYWDAGWDCIETGSYSTDSTFNLGSYTNGFFTAANLTWSRSDFYAGNAGGSKFIRRGDTSEILQTWGLTQDIISYNGENLVNYMNSRVGLTMNLVWASNDGNCTGAIEGFSSGMTVPSISATWQPN